MIATMPEMPDPSLHDFGVSRSLLGTLLIREICPGVLLVSGKKGSEKLTHSSTIELSSSIDDRNKILQSDVIH